MADQNYSNHAKYFPLFHFIAAPILAINLVVEINRAMKAGWNLGSIWNIVFAFGLIALAFAARVMALQVQNRVIRLEMRLRLASILPATMQDRVNDLRPSQLVGLRFASDAELPTLVDRCLSGELAQAGDVKKEIKSWVGDHLRA